MEEEFLRPSRFFINPNGNYHHYKAGQSILYYPYFLQPQQEWTKLYTQKLVDNVNSIHRRGDSTIDWDEVSAELPPFTPIECLLKFRNSADPGINRSPWTEDEEDRLVALAEEFEEHDWCTIAERLGTNRTPIECLRHYQQNFNSDMVRSGDWTPDEDKALMEAVARHGTDSKWQQVAECLKGRSSAQCSARWRLSVRINSGLASGKWLEQEERLLFLSCIAYGAPLMQDTKKSEEEFAALFGSAHQTETTSSGEASVEATLDSSRNTIAVHQDRSTSSGSSSTNNSPSSGIAHSATETNSSFNDCGTTERVTFDLNSGSNGCGGSQNPTVVVAPVRQQARKPTKAESAVFNWSYIARIIPGKSSTQCREKWLNSLDPSVRCGSYSIEEDARLLKIMDFCGVGNWAKLAEYMPGRSDASVRSRGLALLKQRSKGGKGGKTGRRLKNLSEGARELAERNRDNPIRSQSTTCSTENNSYSSADVAAPGDTIPIRPAWDPASGAALSTVVPNATATADAAVVAVAAVSDISRRNSSSNSKISSSGRSSRREPHVTGTLAVGTARKRKYHS